MATNLRTLPPAPAPVALPAHAPGLVTYPAVDERLALAALGLPPLADDDDLDGLAPVVPLRPPVPGRGWRCRFCNRPNASHRLACPCRTDAKD